MSCSRKRACFCTILHIFGEFWQKKIDVFAFPYVIFLNIAFKIPEKSPINRKMTVKNAPKNGLKWSKNGPKKASKEG